MTNGNMIEGPEAYKRFEKAMKAVIGVPRAKVQAQIEEHKKQSALNPNKRGPKRKDAVITTGTTDQSCWSSELEKAGRSNSLALQLHSTK